MGRLRTWSMVEERAGRLVQEGLETGSGRARNWFGKG